MGLLGDLFDLGTEIVKVPIEVTKAVSKPIVDVTDEVVKATTEVVKDINSSIKGD